MSTTTFTAGFSVQEIDEIVSYSVPGITLTVEGDTVSLHYLETGRAQTFRFRALSMARRFACEVRQLCHSLAEWTDAEMADLFRSIAIQHTAAL